MKRFLWFLICITLASLFYVYEEIEAVRVSYTIRKLEESKGQMLDRARALKYNIARLKAPHNLEKKLLAERIQLESPKSWQTLVLSDGKDARDRMAQASFQRTPLFTKFFVGTAQAEAKESQSR